MKNLYLLIVREFRLFWKNKVAVLIFLGAPILYAILTGYVYKDAVIKDLPIAVVDLDNSPLSNQIIDALDDNQYLKTEVIQHNESNMEHWLRNENLQAIITIPNNFEGDIQQLRHPEIDVDINGANLLTANYTTTGVQTVLSMLNAGIEIESLKKKNMPQSIAEDRFESFRIQMSRFYNPSSNYMFFLWPGMLGTILQQVFLLVLALGFAREFEVGSFRYLLRYSKNPWTLILAKSLPYWIMGFLLWFPLIKILFGAFHLPSIEHEFDFWIASGIFIVSITCMGIAASILFRNQLKATEVLMLIATPSFIISGQTWPLSQMPTWIQVISNTIPLTHYLEAFRRLLLYKATFSDIAPQMHALLIISVLCLAIAYFSLHLKIKHHLAKK